VQEVQGLSLCEEREELLCRLPHLPHLGCTFLLLVWMSENLLSELLQYLQYSTFSQNEYVIQKLFHSHYSICTYMWYVSMYLPIFQRPLNTVQLLTNQWFSEPYVPYFEYIFSIALTVVILHLHVCSWIVYCNACFTYMHS
jgi:hypothetical protein